MTALEAFGVWLLIVAAFLAGSWWGWACSREHPADERAEAAHDESRQTGWPQ